MIRLLRTFTFVLLLGISFGCGLVSSPQVLPTLQPTAVLPTPVSELQSTLPPAPPAITSIPTTPANSLSTVPPAPTPLPTATAVLIQATPITAISPTPPPTVAETVTPGYITHIIGNSTQGRPLTDYRFGSGSDHIILVGGIHGGYEWNTILLAYEAIDYFTANPGAIPAVVTLHIIPTANPDGQFLVTGRDGRFSPDDVAANSFPGRFNGNNVDLDRNWDCNWSATAVWRDQTISGGPFPFSELENQVLSRFIVELDPAAVIFWHSAANGVFAASCPDLYRPSYNLANIYGLAAGYPVYESFTSYQVTGDAGDWLALQDIPAVSVELINHESTDWAKNRAGMTAVLTQYQQIK